MYTNLIALQTLIRREIARFIRIWSQTLLPPVITMSLYFIIFGKFIGSQLNNIEGFTYIQYIVPGLVMMSIINNAYANTVSSFFLTKFNRSIEEMLVSPMRNEIILFGFMFGGMLRGLCVGMLVTLVARCFTHIPIAHPFIIISMVILTAMVFSLGGLINGLFAKNFDDISFIPTFIITPLTYFGGVFYSIHQLPPFWQTVSLFNPILAMVDGLRYGFLGITDINISIAFSLVTVLFVFMFIWAFILLRKGVGIKV